MEQAADAIPWGRGIWARWVTELAAARPAWFRQASRSRLLRAIGKRVLAPHAEAVSALYAAEVLAFNERMRSMGVPDIDRYHWYHSINLNDGIVTPGMYDYRHSLDAFHFPRDMHGMTVLDVGSATGFFAFEFERRGATVVSVELPSLEDLDRFPGQDIQSTLHRLHHMNTPHGGDAMTSAHDAYYYLLDAPFRLCARLLNSQVRRRFCTIYDISPERLGRADFDFVFAGDVLVHTLRPFDALTAIASMCSGTLVIAQFMPGGPHDAPAFLYQGGDSVDDDNICWWLPNERCFTELLRKLGFPEVTAVGNYEGLHRPAGNMYSRRVIHAKRVSSAA